MCQVYILLYPYGWARPNWLIMLRSDSLIPFLIDLQLGAKCMMQTIMLIRHAVKA